MAIKTFMRYGVICDRCKNELVWPSGPRWGNIMESNSVTEALSDAWEFEWAHLQDGRDICEDCTHDMVRAREIVRDDKGEWMVLP
jgi:hypothetical protein